jgi:surfactin synthase thioesterase subunit
MKVGQVADHFAGIIGKLKKKPAVIGHSFGGLLTQIVADAASRQRRLRSTRRRSAACCRCPSLL